MLNNIETPNKFTHLSTQEREFIKENWEVLPRGILLKSINKGRARGISLNKLKCAARGIGVFKTDAKSFQFNERGLSSDGLTCKDRDFIKKQFRKGTPVNIILTFVNSGKDIKISEERIEQFINEEVKTINKLCRKTEFTREELLYLKNNSGILSCRLMANEMKIKFKRIITGQTLLIHLKNLKLR